MMPTARRRGYKTLINSGPDGGQEVYHLHLHVIGGAPVARPALRRVCSVLYTLRDMRFAYTVAGSSGINEFRARASCKGIDGFF
jgi:diadenosine tetraphosphate (Ap4A) HIT family hydrolase